MAVKPQPVKTEAPPDTRPDVQYVRGRREGGGWIAETVQVPQALIDSGAVKVQTHHAWDYWPAVERRIGPLLKASEPRR